MIFSIHYTRFILLTLFSIILFSSCKKDDDMVVEFLNNGSLEAGINGSPDDWVFATGNNIYDLDWTTEESHSPSRSLRISTETGDSTNFAFWAQTFNTDIPHGQDVTLNVWIKSELIGNGVSIVIRGDDTDFPDGTAEQFVTTQGSLDISGSFDWSEYSVKLENVDTDINSLTVYLVYLGGTAGTVYFDDVQLQ